MEETFTNIQDYVLHIKGTRATATNGYSTFSGEVESNLVLQYASEKMENSCSEARQENDKLIIVFWQVDAGIRLNKASLELAPIEPIIPVHAITSLICTALHKARAQISTLEGRVDSLEQQLDEMLAAKTELQTDLLSRLHSVLNDRVGQEATNSE